MAGDNSRVPRPLGRSARAEDLRTLPLSALDGFVLSRVDGRLSEHELATLTGLSVEQVRASLDKLASLGVLDFGAGATAEAAPQAAPAAEPLPPPGARAAMPVGTGELDEPGVELDRAFREKILSLYATLGKLDYYELLGVERTADKQTLRRAYFERAAVFHPDKHFRKELGSFKLKMETIFGRLTQAYDTLRSRDGRLEYDTYLADLDRTKGIEAMLREAMEEAKRAEEDLLRGAATVPAATRPLVDGSALGPSPGGTPPAISERARRDALAMRLMGGRPPPVRVAASTLPPGNKPAEAVDALRRRYEERVHQARGQQLTKYTRLAEEAEARGDVVAAANAFKVAASFAKDDPELEKKVKETEAKADALLAETYMRQATYEEREDRWQDAARSWQQVVRGRPKDAHAHERAANALMRSNGDLHQAATLAQRATLLDQANADHKITLANVYLSAGLTLNARRELEAAAQLSPRNATLIALMKRVNKAG